MYNERTEYKVKKQVEVWKEDFIWYQKEFHGASLSWITNLLLHSLREAYENYPEEHRELIKIPTPLSLSIEASVKLRDELKEGMHLDKEEIKL